jgi:hypothetical protein
MSISKIGYNFLGTLIAAAGIVFFTMFFMLTVFSMDDVAFGKILGNTVVEIALFLFILLSPFASVIFFRKEEQAVQLEYINRSVIRYVIAMLMVFYGLGKIAHKFFDITYLTQDTRVKDLDSFFLVWYFYGRSNIQEIIIGFCEFIPAILLLFRRTSAWGIILVLPVALNVLLVNIFNHVSGFTFPLSIFIVGGDIYLLYKWRFRIIAFLGSLMEKHPPQLNKLLRIFRWIFKLTVLGFIIYMIAGSFIFSLFSGNKHTYIGRNKFTGGFELAALKVDDSVIIPAAGDTQYYKNIYIEPQRRWNTVLTFEKEYHPKAITINWNSENDSVSTYLKKQFDVTKDAVDSNTAFNGIYRLKGDTLYIKGIQYHHTIEAKYYKEQLKDYNWFW